MEEYLYRRDLFRPLTSMPLTDPLPCPVIAPGSLCSLICFPFRSLPFPLLLLLLLLTRHSGSASRLSCCPPRSANNQCTGKSGSQPEEVDQPGRPARAVSLWHTAPISLCSRPFIIDTASSAKELERSPCSYTLEALVGRN